ncbi:MAG: hypothetical protein BWY79_01703 [Actinobacteria bacterium ADurb.Bin444]|nr:MAG: hypothetical protein BWY79_01703 [Actinobacteria bacterium ADurb.Bin444]
MSPRKPALAFNPNPRPLCSGGKASVTNAGEVAAVKDAPSP